LQRFEASNYGVAGKKRMLFRMLTWRTITTSDVAAFGASPQM
jgi:hypothetical protein